MNIALLGAFFMAAGIWLILYVIFRERFLRRFFELVFAFVLALLFKKIGIADELAYFGLGFTLALAYFIRGL